jgi:hypothetical protein
MLAWTQLEAISLNQETLTHIMDLDIVKSILVRKSAKLNRNRIHDFVSLLVSESTSTKPDGLLRVSV